MKTRSNETTVTFRKPFALAGLGEVLPAGTFSVEIDEELIEGVPYLAYRRLSTLLRPQSGQGHPTRATSVDPDELEAALARDKVTAMAATSATPPRQEEIDRRAVDRAEDEGMIARPV